MTDSLVRNIVAGVYIEYRGDALPSGLTPHVPLLVIGEQSGSWYVQTPNGDFFELDQDALSGQAFIQLENEDADTTTLNDARARFVTWLGEPIVPGSGIVLRSIVDVPTLTGRPIPADAVVMILSVDLPGKITLELGDETVQINPLLMTTKNFTRTGY